jgi:Short-chain dehydrogenases of various substrate specificities
MKVKDKVILVTGGGNGMGRELVLNLLTKGAKVIAVDINETALKETTELAGKSPTLLTTYVCNITDRAAVEQLYKDVVAAYGGIDGIINNAGIIQPFVRLNDLSLEAIERVINVNFYGTLYMTKTFLPHLLTRPEAHVANVSSMGGFLPVPGQTIYGATKAAVKLMTEGLGAELKDTNVKVTVVFPGAIRTNITENSGIKQNPASGAENSAYKILSPSDAANIIIDAIERDLPRVFVGKDSKFMDLIYRLNPKFATNFIGGKMKALLKSS